jgi:hypothetical protein
MDVDTAKALLARGMPSFNERMEAYLVAAARRSPTLGEPFSYFDPELGFLEIGEGHAPRCPRIVRFSGTLRNR